MALPAQQFYWNTGSTDGTQDGTTNNTGSTGTAAFGTLGAAIQYIKDNGPDLVTAAAGPVTITCTTAGQESTTSNINFTGITTDASNYIIIECTGDARHNGFSRDHSSGTGYQYLNTATDGVGIIANTTKVQLKGIEFSVTATAGYALRSTTGLTTLICDECLFTKSSATTSTTYCVDISYSGPTVTMTNCLILGKSCRGVDTRGATWAIDHCGFATGNDLGVVADSAATITNTWVTGASSECFWTGGTSPTGSYNASEDSSVSTDFPTGAVASFTASSEFTSPSSDPASADFTLLNANLVAAGTGSEPVDITGASRTGTADIGPFNYSAGGSSTALPLLNAYYS